MELIFKHDGLVVHREFEGCSVEDLRAAFLSSVLPDGPAPAELLVDGVTCTDVTQLQPRAIVHTRSFYPNVERHTENFAPEDVCRLPKAAGEVATVAQETVVVVVCPRLRTCGSVQCQSAATADGGVRCSAVTAQGDTSVDCPAAEGGDDAQERASAAYVARKVERFVSYGGVATQRFIAEPTSGTTAVQRWAAEEQRGRRAAVVEMGTSPSAEELTAFVESVEAGVAEGGDMVVILSWPEAGAVGKLPLVAGGEVERKKDGRRAVLWKAAGDVVVAGDEMSCVGARVKDIFSAITHVPPSRPIYLSRHGQSEFNVDDRIGGDCSLTDFGRSFAFDLGAWGAATVASADEEYAELPLAVWTSTLNRAIQSVSEVPVVPDHRRYIAELDEIKAGVMDGLTYADIDATHPEESEKRKADKLTYRYPSGESYLDLLERVQPVLLDLERQTTPTLVLAHQAVLRCVYSYFLNVPLREVPFFSVPSHSVVTLTESPHTCTKSTLLLTPKCTRK
mmetsp:Transcript_12086/g.48658  ORF Transcript_12086/g.48658 Transcript_12086/m.48658 type:complete len:508 (-) Transcript_12086:20-1543(-)